MIEEQGRYHVSTELEYIEREIQDVTDFLVEAVLSAPQMNKYSPEYLRRFLIDIKDGTIENSQIDLFRELTYLEE